MLRLKFAGKWRRRVNFLILVFLVLWLLPLLGSIATFAGGNADWRTAPRHSSGIAPDPRITPQAVVQVYSARAFSWRGAFGVHTWIAVKRSGAARFTVYEVVGWRAYHGGSALVSSIRAPDGLWFGNRPDILADIRGDGVDKIISRIESAVRDYPYAHAYRLWPGPNSNTFTAYIGRAIPELQLDLPPTAIGKDFLPGGALAASTPSGTGYQVSVLGLAGLAVALEEGLELNLLELTFGVDINRPAIKLPGFGRIGLGPS